MKLKVFALALSVIVLFSLSGCNNYGKEKDFGNLQLFYKDGVSMSEVDNLGDYLERNGFDKNGTRKTVQLAKDGNTYQFRMVVKKGLEQDAEYAQFFKNWATTLSKDVFNGAPVELHACDDHLKTLRVFPMHHQY